MNLPLPLLLPLTLNLILPLPLTLLLALPLPYGWAWLLRLEKLSSAQYPPNVSRHLCPSLTYLLCLLSFSASSQPSLQTPAASSSCRMKMRSGLRKAPLIPSNPEC